MLPENSNPPGISPQPPEAEISSVEDLKAAASNPGLTEDLCLALLKRNHCSPEILEQLGKSSLVRKSRKAKLALLAHGKTPRHISLAILRQLFTFDLMRVALTPTVAGDIKMAADEALINRLETISSGERISLARRASARIAGALLIDSEPRVIHAALDNPRLTQAPIIKALARETATAALVAAVCRHAKWSLRREVRIALLRNGKTPLARALDFAQALPAALVREILQNSHLPGTLQALILRNLSGRDAN